MKSDNHGEVNCKDARRMSRGVFGEQSLFGIFQGGSELDLREQSLEQIVEIDFDGYAIGGLSVGESKPVRNILTTSNKSISRLFTRLEISL